MATATYIVVSVSPPVRRLFEALKGKSSMDARFDRPLPEDEYRVKSGLRALLDGLALI
ncbi:glycosyltransferase family protein [Novosphingobium gossypii]|uniref:hypothetical protein n=1 Tax=Novosphingobium gossypii TaxID=1604774 RepID=UPI003D251E57